MLDSLSLFILFHNNAFYNKVDLSLKKQTNIFNYKYWRCRRQFFIELNKVFPRAIAKKG